MRAYWMLRGGESVEVYDGEDLAKGKTLIYRIGVERFFQAEVKLVRPKAKTKMLSRESRSHLVDVAVVGALFLEVTGKDGCAFGWYEAIGEPF
jgi:hypothetical protein